MPFTLSASLHLFLYLSPFFFWTLLSFLPPLPLFFPPVISSSPLPCDFICLALGGVCRNVSKFWSETPRLRAGAGAFVTSTIYGPLPTPENAFNNVPGRLIRRPHRAGLASESSRRDSERERERERERELCQNKKILRWINFTIRTWCRRLCVESELFTQTEMQCLMPHP